MDEQKQESPESQADKLVCRVIQNHSRWPLDGPAHRAMAVELVPIFTERVNLIAQNKQLAEILREIVLNPPTFSDERLRYETIQVDKADLEAAKEILALLPKE